MRRSLKKPVPKPMWPAGIGLVTFEPESHAEQVHALLVEAYAQGGGNVEPCAIWWPSLRDDPEYDPALVFIAANDQGDIVGMAQCWTGAFVKDVAVALSMRRNGLGSALLHHALRGFRERGVARVELKVESDNPSGALNLYHSLGFEKIES